MKTNIQLVVVMLSLLHLQTTAQTQSAPTNGDGTAGNPYEIATLENLFWLTQSDTAWSRYFIQTQNINAAASSGWASGAGFTPIGNNTTKFRGSYDGQGYAIDSIYINRANVDHQGLFGVTGHATIANLGVTNVNITSGSWSGALAGSANDTTNITNCYSSGSVSSTVYKTYKGGLVGYIYMRSTVVRSYSTCSVRAGNYAGGFAGYLIQYSKVYDCYSRGSVTRTNLSTDTLLAAFCPYVSSNSEILRSYSTGSIAVLSGSVPTTMGFVSVNLGTCSNNLFDSTSSNQVTGNGAAPKTTEEMKTLSTFTGLGWDFVLESANGTNNYWDMDTTSQVWNDGYPFLSWENGSGDALPVQLGALSAEREAEGVVLRWSTVTEVDNAGFEIQRREIVDSRLTIDDSRVTSSEWTTIGFVEGHGTSASPQMYLFVDEDVPPGTHEYRLKQVDRNGAFEYTRALRIDVAGAAQKFAIGQNFPNPFNPSTTLSYTLAMDSHVTLDIYDALGRRVARLVDEVQQAGISHEAVFSAVGMASGMYYARLESGGMQLTRKIVLMK